MKTIAVALLVSTVSLVSPRLLAQPPGDPSLVRACQPVPRGKPVVKIELKPDSALSDLINFYGTLSCKRPKLPARAFMTRVSFSTPRPITLDDLSRATREATTKAGFDYEETEIAIIVRP